MLQHASFSVFVEDLGVVRGWKKGARARRCGGVGVCGPGGVALRTHSLLPSGPSLEVSMSTAGASESMAPVSAFIAPLDDPMFPKMQSDGSIRIHSFRDASQSSWDPI